MRRIFLLFPLLALGIGLVSCSGKSSIGPAAMPTISGAWEFIAASSTTPGYSTGVEVALKQGQVLVDGVYQPTGDISASGDQINFVGFTPGAHQNGPPNIVLGGNCTPATSNTGNSLSGTLSGFAGSMNFTYTENGNVFNVSATLDASGQSIDSGTYTEVAGAGNGVCNGDAAVLDSGTIVTGKVVSKPTGTYTGKLILPDGTSDSVTATVTVSSSGSLTMNVIASAPDNSAFSLSGPITGAYFSVTGTFNIGGQVQSVTYNGYYELAFDSRTSAYDIQTLYIVNATDSAAPTYAGTLSVPQM